MKIVCAPKDFDFSHHKADLVVILYGNKDRQTRGGIGAAVMHEIVHHKLRPAPRAWDLLSLALSVMAADLAGHRNRSTDGWTREFELAISVMDTAFWQSQAMLIEKLLAFLTTDRWKIRFYEHGLLPVPDKRPTLPNEDSIVLLSGGLDSFIGALDLDAKGKKLYAVSQIVRGDAEKQQQFAGLIGGGLRHLQVNHNADLPDQEDPPSQRARSIIFLAYGILAATTLARYHAGKDVPLYVCENGFIAINPPLTDTRLGSLSTRTAHPVFLALLQMLLDAAGLRVRIENPYQLKTKGEMLKECQDNNRLKAYACGTTSCGRFKQYGYTHCGRCVPCLIRRAAIYAWGINDTTGYVYKKLGKKDEDHARFDDVRSAAMAVAEVQAEGIDKWLGTSLTSTMLTNVAEYRKVAARGLKELGGFLSSVGVK